MTSVYGNTITLASPDGMEFKVDGRVPMNSNTIRRMLEHKYPHTRISLPSVRSNVLSKVIQYCYMHADGAADDQLKSWDEQFIYALDRDALFDLLLAANYLEIGGLVDLVCRAMAPPTASLVVAAPPPTAPVAPVPPLWRQSKFIMMFFCIFVLLVLIYLLLQ